MHCLGVGWNFCADAILVIYFFVYDPHSVWSIVLGWCPFWVSMYGVPLGLPIPQLRLSSSSDAYSIVARLSGAYFLFPFLVAWFILFWWNSVGAYQGISSDFSGGNFTKTFPDFQRLLHDFIGMISTRLLLLVSWLEDNHIGDSILLLSPGGETISSFIEYG